MKPRGISMRCAFLLALKPAKVRSADVMSIFTKLTVEIASDDE